MRRLFILLLLGFSSAASSTSMSPEEEYTLQARVLLQDDENAREALSAISEDAVPDGAIDWQPVIDDVPSWLVKQGFEAPSKPVMNDLLDALRLRLPLIVCIAEEFVPAGSPEKGQFTLACASPDIEPAFVAYRALRSADTTQRKALSDAFFSTYAERVRNGPSVDRRTTLMGWSSFRHTYVHADRAEQLYETVLFGLLPFAEWDLRISSAARASVMPSVRSDTFLATPADDGTETASR